MESVKTIGFLGVDAKGNPKVYKSQKRAEASKQKAADKKLEVVLKLQERARREAILQNATEVAKAKKVAKTIVRSAGKLGYTAHARSEFFQRLIDLRRDGYSREVLRQYFTDRWTGYLPPKFV